MVASGAKPESGSQPATGAARRDWRPLLIVAILLEIFAVWFVHWIHTRGYGDTEIYQLGARALLHGYEIYGDLTPETPDSSTLPFIYPPFAAALFVPLYALPGKAAVVVVSVLSHLSILVTSYALAVRSPYIAARTPYVVLGTAALLPWTTLIEPTRETLNYGQINLILMGLVAADCLLQRTRWPRGLLLGIAAGIKLTPLGFGLFFLLRRDFRALAVSAGTFAGTVLLGALAAPRDSIDWWFGEMLSTGDSMGTAYAGNLTVRSLLAKQELDGLALNLLWIAGSLALLGLTVWAMRYAAHVANTPLMLMFNAILIVLISPISWSHHWIWAAPTLALLLAMAVWHRWHGTLLAVIFAGVTVLAGPQWYLPYTDDREMDWTFSQQIVGNSYTLFGIAFIICGAVAYWRWSTRYGTDQPGGRTNQHLPARTPGGELVPHE